MKSLTVEQLEHIPWIGKHNTGPGLPEDPPVQKINELLNLPFSKRSGIYGSFYIWAEIIDLIPGENLKILDWLS